MGNKQKKKVIPQRERVVKRPKLTPEQRMVKADAWRELDYRRPRLEDL